MVRSIAVFSGKGGVGKTTIAAALAQLAGLTLIDADGQLSATDWRDRREEALPQVLSCQLGRVPQQIRTHGPAVVDMPGAVVANTALALSAVDLIVIPTSDSRVDRDALPATIETVTRLDVPAVLVLNRVHPSVAAATALSTLEGAPVPVAPMLVRDRAVHRHAWELGQTAAEYEPEGAGASEMRALWQWLLQVQP